MSPPTPSARPPRDRASDASVALPCACGRLRRASRALTQLYDQALAPARLRVTQFALMRALQRCGTVGISDLAARELLDRTALSRNLEPLIAGGLVAVARGRDARTRQVRLTAAGEAALRDAEPHWQRVQDDVTRRIGAAKLEVLVAALGDVEALHPHGHTSPQEHP